jgi:aspartate aminotransferase-like enzyme
VVCYSKENLVPWFIKAGIQVAGPVPFMLEEKNSMTFRVGLFGLDKLKDVDGTVKNFKDVLEDWKQDEVAAQAVFWKK